MKDELLTTQKAAERMGKSVQLVQRLCKDGLLPTIRPGKDYLIYASDVDNYKPKPRGRPPGRPKEDEPRPSKKTQTNGKR
jgi:excisionase family DNA binding protein